MSELYSSLFDSNNKAKKVFSPASGTGAETATLTIPTTQVDTIADFTGMCPVPCGRDIFALFQDSGDFDSNGSPTLDMDIILRTWNAAGTATDTILWNAGTAFQAAVAGKVIQTGLVRVPASRDGYGVVGYYVNTVAATAAEQSSTLTVLYR